MKLDTFTTNHLQAWAGRFFPWDEVESNVREITSYLQGMDKEDAEYLVNQGWLTVFDRMKETRLC